MGSKGRLSSAEYLYSLGAGSSVYGAPAAVDAAQPASLPSSLSSNMIAKLANGAASATNLPASSQCKRKRAKLIDMLLTTNWSKQSQQAKNLMKLSKLLLACNPNFIDEKSAESPLGLAIVSPQISSATNGTHNNATTASLFSLQCQTSNQLNQSSLHQTNISDLSHSTAPFVERIILLFVKSGAQIDFANSNRQTPLHLAAMKSNFWALKTLLDLGASTCDRDINGLTPLYYSILHKADLKVTQLLLNSCRATASQRAVGIKDQQGWQEVHQACKLGLDSHLEKLLYHGCDMDAKISGSGNTPLHVAAINDQLSCAKVLLMRGADKSITNNSHQTAHQVAVISNNMDLAEFIAEHNDSKVIPFAHNSFGGRSMVHQRDPLAVASNGLHTSHPLQAATMLTNSQSSANISSSRLTSSDRGAAAAHFYQPPPTASSQVKGSQQVVMAPLSLDVAPGVNGASLIHEASSTINNQPHSLLSINSHHHQQHLSGTSSGTNQHLNIQVNNISPCLSQRSCATSNTTSSSGVCCDGDGNNSADDHLQQQHLKQNLLQNQPTSSLSNGSQNHHATNITVISIDNNNKPPTTATSLTKPSRQMDELKSAGSCNGSNNINDMDEDTASNYHEDNMMGNGRNSSGSGSDDSASSSSDLFSIMHEDCSLLIGTVVQARSDYQSGDPGHLQLQRGDIVEVLPYTADLLQAGQLPRLANKLMLYGRHLKCDKQGLFPSFCVQQNKHLQTHKLKKRSHTKAEPHQASSQQVDLNHQNQHQHQQAFGSANEHSQLHGQQQQTRIADANPLKAKFKELRVSLSRNESGFGFILRGAKIDPSTLPLGANGASHPAARLRIDERLMAANNLISLQYLDNIEPDSPAYNAGLRRGDFLVAVNDRDVRFDSHEQVVHMIIESGERVNLTIATPIPTSQPPVPTYTTRAALNGKVKPEPPKRDSNTTLSRNKGLRAKSMLIQRSDLSQIQQTHPVAGPGCEPFDANKPLPMMPFNGLQNKSPSSQDCGLVTGPVNVMGRSVSSHFYSSASRQSLSSLTTDSQSISSISTLAADQKVSPQEYEQQELEQLNESQQATPTHSTSSTATLTTVHTAAFKPKAPPKPFKLAKGATYQPAIIRTNRIKSQPGSPTGETCIEAEQSNGAVINSSASLPEPTVAPPPPPPPPPPPLASLHTFSGDPAPSSSTLARRRISAPVIAPSLLTEASQQLRKRDSVASMGVTSPLNTQIGAVAAACAAAANFRLQRQLKQQPDPLKLVEQPDVDLDKELHMKLVIDSGLPAGEIKYGDSIDETGANREHVVNDKSPEEHVSLPAVNNTQVNSSSQQRKTIVSNRNWQTGFSLGRKSSAQVIQQPKQQLSAHQSHTLRAKPLNYRPSIVTAYDDLPLPPPPPPMLDDSDWPASAAQQQQQFLYQQPLQLSKTTCQHAHVPPSQANRSSICMPEMDNCGTLQQNQFKKQAAAAQEALYRRQQLLMQQQKQQHHLLLHQQQQQQLQLKTQRQYCVDQVKSQLHQDHHHKHYTEPPTSDHHLHSLSCTDTSTTRGHHHHHHHLHYSQISPHQPLQSNQIHQRVLSASANPPTANNQVDYHPNHQHIRQQQQQQQQQHHNHQMEHPIHQQQPINNAHYSHLNYHHHHLHHRHHNT